MAINKKASKIQKFFEILSVETVFVVFIIPLHVITESSIILAKYLPFLQLHVGRIPNITLYTHYIYTNISIYRCSTFDLHYIFYHQIYIYIRMKCFVNVFSSFLPVIMLKTLRFKSSVLFGKHTFLERSLRVLQLLKYLSKYNRKCIVT